MPIVDRKSIDVKFSIKNHFNKKQSVVIVARVSQVFALVFNYAQLHIMYKSKFNKLDSLSCGC